MVKKINFNKKSNQDAENVKDATTNGNVKKITKQTVRDIQYVITMAVPLVVFCVFLQRAVLIRHIPSASMEPTIKTGDVVLVNAMSYQADSTVRRGDVVVFRYKGNDLIKRVVATSGDTVDIANGEVLVNGEAAQQYYIKDDVLTDGETHLTVPSGKVFVLGDNRSNSKDSRMIGCISTDDILGQAFFDFGFNRFHVEFM